MPPRRPPLDRLRTGAAAVLILLMAAVVGYRLSGKTWLDSVYFVVITLSTVGYGETSDFDAWVKVLTILLIVVGGTALAYFVGGLLQMVVEGEVDRVLGRRRMTRDIQRLQNHAIVCGFGRTGEILASELHQRGKPFVVVDASQDRVEEATALGYNALTDNAAEEETLLSAGIERAHSLVAALPGDAENVFLTLTARNLNPKLQIIARAEFPKTEKKLLQAGANRVVLPTAIGAMRMAMMLTRPTALGLVELVSGRVSGEVEIDEITIGQNSPLVGRTVRDANIRQRHGLLVIGVQRRAGQLLFNPNSDVQFHVGDAVIVLGLQSDVDRFMAENHLQR